MFSSSLFRRNVLIINQKCPNWNFSTEATTISIPKRIQRGPTDILRALADVHKRDLTAPHYKYHDDPYLIPYSNSTKRSYALSQEAGRKAAYWIRQQHPELFTHSEADPPIEAFQSKKQLKEGEVTVSDLVDAIHNLVLGDAITLYDILEKQGVEIDGEIKQALLELACFYNSEDVMSTEWMEESWFKSDQMMRAPLKKTWKENSFAEKLFNSIQPPTAEAYCAIISGMSKFGNLDSAVLYFEEAEKNGFSLNVTVYNNLLSRVVFIKEGHELIWKYAENLLKKMNEKKIKPNIDTFNAVLETLSRISTFRLAKSLALGILKEMQVCKIEPSLTSFYHVLNIYYSERAYNSGILYDIIEYLEGKQITARNSLDVLFFGRAIEVCRNKLHDPDLGYRIYNLLNKDNNYSLVGDSFKESNFYRYLFFLICEGESIEDFMELYERFVPHIYIPEPAVMVEILNSVELNHGYNYLPKLWSDIVQFDLTDRQNILEKILILANQWNDESSYPELIKIGWSVWEKIEGETRERINIGWTGPMLGDLLSLFVKTSEFDKASLVLGKMISRINNLTGEPNIASLRMYLDGAIAQNNPDAAIKLIRYCKDLCLFEAEEFAQQLRTSLPLSEQHISRLNLIVLPNSETPPK